MLYNQMLALAGLVLKHPSGIVAFPGQQQRPRRCQVSSFIEIYKNCCHEAIQRRRMSSHSLLMERMPRVTTVYHFVRGGPSYHSGEAVWQSCTLLEIERAKWCTGAFRGRFSCWFAFSGQSWNWPISNINIYMIFCWFFLKFFLSLIVLLTTNDQAMNNFTSIAVWPLLSARRTWHIYLQPLASDYAGNEGDNLFFLLIYE